MRQQAHVNTNQGEGHVTLQLPSQNAKSSRRSTVNTSVACGSRGEELPPQEAASSLPDVHRVSVKGVTTSGLRFELGKREESSSSLHAGPGRTGVAHRKIGTTAAGGPCLKAGPA